MKFSAKGLPAGLALDSASGRITGRAGQNGDYAVALRARNAHGADERKLHIVIGDKLALTPPMGWSTWYMAKTAISDRMVRAQADAMVSSGMIEHGYAYINIDDGWNIRPDSPDPALGGPARDETVIKDESVAERQKPYRLMGELLKKQDRDFVYNLCFSWSREWGREVGGHYWRTGGDIGAGKQGLWENLVRFGFGQAGMEKWAGPGGWNDPDNILIGHIFRYGKVVPTPLTPNEQYTWVSLWSMMAAPLVFGGDMTRLDDFTLSLLTNDEVIDINQDPLGKQAAPVARIGDVEVWSKELVDGSKAVRLFNRGGVETEIAARWPDLSIHGRQVVRDVWRQKDLGRFNGEFKASVASHGVVLIKITPVR